MLLHKDFGSVGFGRVPEGSGGFVQVLMYQTPPIGVVIILSGKPGRIYQRGSGGYRRSSGRREGG